MSKISFLPLGGQDERNKNSFILKINDQMFIFNCGVKVPINSLYGVSMIAPDYSILENNKNNIKGIFIGYPSFYNHASLTFLLEKINKNTPIYCSEIGKIVIETYLEKKNPIFYKNNKLNFKVVHPLKPFMIGTNEIVPFSICNSIPGSLGWAIKTDDGYIIHLDEFMINNDHSKVFQSQLSKIDQITKHNNLALITSLGNVGKHKSFTTPNHKNFAFYESIIKKAKGRVLIACNDTDAYTIINLAKIAKDNGRPFSIYGNTFMNVFSTIVKQKFINIKGLNCLPVSEINDSENAVVIIAATHEQLFKRLMLIADSQIKTIEPKNTDTFILGTQLLPGYEGHAAQLLDKLSKLDMDLFILPKTVLPMNASNEDHKFILDTLNPKLVIPIQGLYKSVVKFQQVANETKVKLDPIHFLDNGEELFVINGEVQKKKHTIKLNEKYINNSGVDDASSSILFERQKLSEAGSILATLFIDKNTQQFINKIEYKTYGVVAQTEENELTIKKIFDEFKKQIPNFIIIDPKTKKIAHKDVKNTLKKLIMKSFEKKFNKRPIVLICIIEMD